MIPAHMPESARSLLSRTFTAVPYWISDGLLNKGSMLIVGGPPKAFKSFLVNTMCSSLTTGVPFLGAFAGTEKVFTVSQPAKVLFIEQEMGQEGMQDRMRLHAEKLPASIRDTFLDNLYIHSSDYEVKLDTPPGIAKIDNIIAEVNPDILILDPLIEFHRSNENNSGEMGKVLDVVGLLQLKYGLSVIITHHTAKLSEATVYRRGAQNLRGSSYIHGRADTFIMVHPVSEHPPCIKLQYSLRRGKPVRSMRCIAGDDMLFRFLHWEDEKAVPTGAVN